MSNYLTVSDFIARCGETRALQVAGMGPRDDLQIDRVRVQTEIDFASGMINGYVRGRYPAAFNALPEILKACAYDIVHYRLRDKGGDQSGMSQTVKDRYEDAVRLLRDIQAGKVALDAEDVRGQSLGPAAPDLTIRSSLVPSRSPKLLEGY